MKMVKGGDPIARRARRQVRRYDIGRQGIWCDCSCGCGRQIRREHWVYPVFYSNACRTYYETLNRGESIC